MDTALIDHGPGVARSVSKIPLVGRISLGSSSLSSPSSSPPHEPAATSNPSGGNAAPATAATSPPRTRPFVPPATAGPTSTEDVSKLDLAMMGCSISFVVPVALYIKDLTSSWETPWKTLYGILMILSLASTVTGFFTAWCPAVSWRRRLSPTCTRFGLVDSVALFIVFLSCKLGRFGCASGVAAAALVVLLLAVVWAWSERPATTGQAEDAATVQGGAGGLPQDVP